MNENEIGNLNVLHFYVDMNSQFCQFCQYLYCTYIYLFIRYNNFLFKKNCHQVVIAYSTYDLYCTIASYLTIIKHNAVLIIFPILMLECPNKWYCCLSIFARK